MKQFLLSDGTYTQVDDEDYEHLLNITKNWTFNSKYVKCHRGGKHIFMHIEIARRTGIDISEKVDHKDKNTKNNQRYNLRAATYGQDKINQVVQKNNFLGYRNICRKKQSYQVRVQKDHRPLSLGYYKTIEEAVRVRDKWLQENWGEFVPENPDF